MVLRITTSSLHLMTIRDEDVVKSDMLCTRSVKERTPGWLHTRGRWIMKEDDMRGKQW